MSNIINFTICSLFLEYIVLQKKKNEQANKLKAIHNQPIKIIN